MEQSPKQSPAAVEPVADLIEELEQKAKNLDVRYPEQSAYGRAAASLSQLSTKLAETDLHFANYIAVTDPIIDELRAKLVEAREVAFEEAAQIADEYRATTRCYNGDHKNWDGRKNAAEWIADTIRARAVKGAGHD